MVEGVRARKKRERREEIVRVARALFDDRGYAGTTTAEIAAGAGISLTTLFSYFRTKNDLLFSDCLIREEALQEQLEQRPDGASAIDVTIGWAAERMPEFLIDDPAWAPIYRRSVDSDPALQAEERIRLGATKRIMLPALARDLDDADDGIRAQLVAHSLVGTLIAINSCRFRDELAVAANREMLLTTMTDFLHAGMEALRRPLGVPA